MKLTAMAKKLIGAILVILLLVIVAGVTLALTAVLDIRPALFALGALLGGGLNVIKVLLLDRMVRAASQREEGKAARGAHLQAILRFALTAVVLGLSLLVPDRSFFWGTVAGVFILPIAAFSMRFVRHEEEG